MDPAKASIRAMKAAETTLLAFDTVKDRISALEATVRCIDEKLTQLCLAVQLDEAEPVATPSGADIIPMRIRKGSGRRVGHTN
jgi:hypothetical protein